VNTEYETSSKLILYFSCRKPLFALYSVRQVPASLSKLHGYSIGSLVRTVSKPLHSPTDSQHFLHRPEYTSIVTCGGRMGA
jgi:hypothetical protein